MKERKEKREKKKNSYYHKVNILSGHISLEYGKPLTVQYTNKIYIYDKKTALYDVNKFVRRTKVLSAQYNKCKVADIDCWIA